MKTFKTPDLKMTSAADFFFLSFEKCIQSTDNGYKMLAAMVTCWNTGSGTGMAS